MSVSTNTQQKLARVAKASGRGTKAFIIVLVTLLFIDMFFHSAE